MNRLICSASRGALQNGLARTHVTRVVVSPLCMNQTREYAKGAPMKKAVSEQKYEGDEYIDKVLKSYGMEVPTWEDLPDWVWQLEVELQDPKPLTPLSGRQFWKKINTHRIRTGNENRSFGDVGKKWKL